VLIELDGSLLSFDDSMHTERADDWGGDDAICRDDGDEVVVCDEQDEVGIFVDDDVVDCECFVAVLCICFLKIDLLLNLIPQTHNFACS
jgi:hypothetical protein